MGELEDLEELWRADKVDESLSPHHRTLLERIGSWSIHVVFGEDVFPLKSRTSEALGAAILTGVIVGANQMLSMKTGINPLEEFLKFGGETIQ